MQVWGVNKLKDPNSNHILRKVIKRREQLLTREQTPKVIKRREQLLQRQQTPKVLKQLKYLDSRMDIGQMLLKRWHENH